MLPIGVHDVVVLAVRVAGIPQVVVFVTRVPHLEGERERGGGLEVGYVVVFVTSLLIKVVVHF